MHRLDTVDQLDYRDYLRRGDRLVWGQACGEPLTLVEHLRTAALPDGLSAFVGINVASALRAEHAARLQLISYIGSGSNSALHAEGLLTVLPQHYSALPAFVGGPGRPADVVLLRMPPPDPEGRISLGANHDYLLAAIESARVVIAEIDDRVPFTYGDAHLTVADISVAVPARLPGAELAARPPNAVQQRVAAHAAELIDDGATLQVGVGALPNSVLGQLTTRRHLGLHTGQIPDAAIELIEAGVLTGEQKSLDAGLAVGGMLLGTQRLFDYAHRNRAISLRRAEYTHDHQVLAQQTQLAAVNSALEVDLSGQVNCEVAGNRYVGAVGGAVDFARGANASPGGQAIIMLPSTAGARSCIVPRLSGPVTIARSDAVVVVTEHGCADLRGLTLTQRAEALIAIADPAHRGGLSAAADGALAARDVPTCPARARGEDLGP